MHVKAQFTLKALVKTSSKKFPAKRFGGHKVAELKMRRLL